MSLSSELQYNKNDIKREHSTGIYTGKFQIYHSLPQNHKKPFTYTEERQKQAKDCWVYLYNDTLP